MDLFIKIAKKVMGIKEKNSMFTKTQVTHMNEEQKSLLQQHEIVTEAARKLLDVAEEIFADFESSPSWSDVQKHWKAVELSECVIRNL